MDIRQEITNRIIEMIADGRGNYKKGWQSVATAGMPRNGKTNAAYKGVNVILLLCAAAERGFTSNVWLTYKQAQEMGANVRKGEKGTMCAYFELMRKKGSENETEGDDEDGQTFMMCKPFWVFNVAQVDGLPEGIGEIPASEPAFDPIHEAEALLEKSGAKIQYGFDKAFYQPGSDYIGLPSREAFYSRENFYATALHELTHWTGHPSRCNRQFGKRFGDQAYAFEELVAELGSAFLNAHVGLVDATIERHAGYVESWLAVLKRDKTAIFSAASQASKAVEYLKHI